MNDLLHADISFPAWLTLSSVWEQSMDDPGETKAVIGRNLCRLREERKLSGDLWPSWPRQARLHCGKSRPVGFYPPLA